MEFIDTNLICRFRIPFKLIMDNGLPFKNKDVRDLCDKYNIQLSFSTPYSLKQMDKQKNQTRPLLKLFKNLLEIH